jgi:hypothetical protein
MKKKMDKNERVKIELSEGEALKAFLETPPQRKKKPKKGGKTPK